MAKKTKDGVRVIAETTEMLPVKLTVEEKLQKGAELARLENELCDHLANAKCVKKDLSANEARIKSHQSAVATCLRAGAESRSVEVRIEADDTKGLALFRRLDTQEIIRQRKLSADEQQLKLEDAPKPENKDAKKEGE